MQIFRESSSSSHEYYKNKWITYLLSVQLFKRQKSCEIVSICLSFPVMLSQMFPLVGELVVVFSLACLAVMLFSWLFLLFEFCFCGVSRPVTPEETTFHLLHLSLMREYLDYEFSPLKVCKEKIALLYTHLVSQYFEPSQPQRIIC